MLSTLAILFFCSFSSFFSAILLIFSSFMVMSIMYWNLIPLIPLYLFSLFLLGGLYVLIGFVMMADVRDLDMVLSGEKIKEFLISLVSVYLGLKIVYPLEENLNLYMIEFSPMKTFSWLIGTYLSITFLFLIVFLLIYLLVLHIVVKSSSSGGFVN
uniref:NADH dehydrogenase subunit 6 n=1 Tax=Brueelia nebulosa TaxID=2972756 RepID=UPI0023AA8478|nr:NADH dehydrogenase subunit 6 [Brueelia nebulosa]WCF77114.1 NADH dehydrogenase subunit 6 [Brueelia nebulosa]